MILQDIKNPNPYSVSDYRSETLDDELKEIAYVNSLAKFNNNNSYDFWYGIISGFPLCCIDYYINEWSYTIYEIFDEVKDILDADNTVYYNNELQTHVQRTMCPLCIIKEMKKYYYKNMK